MLKDQNTPLDPYWAQPIYLKPRDSPLRLIPHGSVAPNVPPHSLTRPSLTRSSLTLILTRRLWRWHRRHGRRRAPASSELPRHSHLPNRNRRVQIYRSVRVVFPISSSPGESPPIWILGGIASTNSGELSPSPTMCAPLRLTWCGCCSQYSCRRLRCSATVVFVFAGVTSAPTLDLQLLGPREHCLAMP